MNSNIPPVVVDAVNGLLRPYGVDLSKVQNGDLSPRYITARQASTYCGLKPRTLRDKAVSGEIKSIRIGNSDKSRILILKSDLDRWLESFASPSSSNRA
ncbi:MAG: helix-turn-helix domain-containing protein [Victivallaceae bacterium]